MVLFDVKDGNPNGDPDAGNLPRVDIETGHGLITDVCLKRKIRNYVGIKYEEKSPYEIYVKEKAVLNQTHERAYEALKVNLEVEETENSPVQTAKGKAKRKGKDDQVGSAKSWMCQNFYDVRTFGAVMSTGVNCGQVRGPVQMTFSRSIDPIVSLEHTITRMAVTTKEEAENQDGDNRTMGRKYTVSYGLYRCHGFISCHLANQVGFNEEDLKLFWEALQYMFDHDRSASRGQMAIRALYIFKHDSILGNAPAHKLFDLISVKRKTNVSVARDFSDYEINLNETACPTGVSIQKLC